MVIQQQTQSGTRLTKQDAINVALVMQDIAYIKSQLQDINATLKSDFVKKEEFTPVRNLVYAFVGLIVIAVVGALLALVVVHPGASSSLPVTTNGQTR